jgi:alpha-glucosidase
MEFLDSEPEVLAFRRDPDLVCVVNCGPTVADVSGYGELVVTSGNAEEVAGGSLRPDTAAWFRG